MLPFFLSCFTQCKESLINQFPSFFSSVCSHVAQAQISAVIVTRDKCPESDDIAGVASHATNPILAVDLESYGSGSRAFKMYPSADDLNNFFIEVLSYFNWRNFMLLYDDPTG